MMQFSRHPAEPFPVAMILLQLLARVAMTTFTDVMSSAVLNKDNEGSRPGLAARLLSGVVSRCFFLLFGPPD
jgi:hypothetical protein